MADFPSAGSVASALEAAPCIGVNPGEPARPQAPDVKSSETTKAVPVAGVGANTVKAH